MSHKNAVTSVPVLSVLAERWSPRSFDAAATLTTANLMPALEAARWAPSASNGQPTRFIAGLRGGQGFDLILEHLATGNARWAKNASALMVNVAIKSDEAGNKNRWAEYDLGQAVAHFSVQAHSEGLYVHQMGGFDADALHEALKLPAGQEVVSVLAVGQLAEAHAADLAEHQLAQELGARSRREIAEVATFI